MANMICLHGDSGNGKTSVLGSFVQYVMKQGGKARLVTADNIDVLEPYIDAGCLEVWPIALWDHPFEVIDYATQGYFPVDPKDPKSKLVAPSAETWATYKLMMFEGLSHFSDMLMKRLADLGGEGKYLGPGTRVNPSKGEADMISFKDGEYGVGGNSMTHYGLVQKEMRKNILNTSVLPVQTIWTAHTIKATEDTRPIYGPQLAGLKATAKAQAWFSSTIHAHTVEEKGKISYRLYLKEHVDKACGPYPFKALQRIPLPLLDSKLQQTITNKWNEIVPEYIEWTNDSTVAERYMEIRNKMRNAAKQIIIESNKGE